MNVMKIDIANTLIIPTIPETKYLHCNNCDYFYEGCCYAKSVAAGIISVASIYAENGGSRKLRKHNFCSFVKELDNSLSGNVSVLQFD